MSKFLAISLMIVTFLLGIGFGFYVTPSYVRMNNVETMEEEETDHISDKNFTEAIWKINQKITSLAQQAKENSQREEAKLLANDMATTLGDEVEVIQSWNDLWVPAGTIAAIPENTITLGSYDEQFDLRFMNAVGQICMDIEELTKKIRFTSTNNDVLTLATNLSTASMRIATKAENYKQAWYATDHDLKYIRSLILHHYGAVALLKQAVEKSDRKEIKDFAETVIKSEEASIDELYLWKKLWFDDEEQLTPKAPIDLGIADKEFDQRFITMLKTQLEDAVMMATAMKTKTMKKPIAAMIEKVETTLPSVIEQLTTWENTWYSEGVKNIPEATTLPNKGQE